MNDKSDDETEDEPSQELYGDKNKELVTESRNYADVAESIDGKNEPKPKKPDWIQKGVKCMSLYSGDNRYYRAIIQEVLAEDQVEVIFIGFESEGKEQVSFKHLKRIAQNIIPNKNIDESTKNEEQIASGSFFTHLEGFEMDKELRTKYEDFGDTEFDILSEDTKSNKKKSRKRKGLLDVSTHKNNKLLRRKKKRKASLNMNDTEVNKPDDGDMEVTETERTVVKKRLRSQDQDDRIDEWCDMDGFDDKDMEKPHFSEPAPCPFVPLVLSAPGIEPPIQVPATINCRLREYQREGVKFLYEHYHGNKGAILGDDMGLGKTVQVIAFLAAVLGKTGTKVDVFGKYMNQGVSQKAGEKKCFLVVSPASVLYNWLDELDTWGHFKVKVYHGNKKEGVLEEAAKNKLDVVLTTYDTLRINLKKFNKVSWSAVIMDEVHKVKDPEAQITVAAKALNITRRFGLTGTPLQNRFDEFWSVLDWANPGCLGSSREFTKKYSKPVKKGQRYDVTKRELAIGRTISKNFQAKLGQWFLRRTKDLIADQLPQKDERVVFCNLTSFQEDVYVTLLQSPDVQLITKKDNPCDCGSGLTRGHCCYTEDENGESLRSVLMRYLQLMLKAANHTALLMPQVKQTEDQRIKAKAICDKVFSRHPEYAEAMAKSSFQTLSDPSYCGKMKVLDQLLKMFEKEKSKVLLFSQSTQLLDILEEYLIGRGMMYSRLDGKTTTKLRPVIVREFNNNPETFVCLVSTKAGALGLNFTGANVVIIFDPTWNPANDLQAQDRAYRIGQRRNVQVFRLITSGTIEEMIYLRQVYKQQMANIAVRGTSERRYFIGVEGEKDLKGELFGMENLFSYRAEGVSLAHDIIQRTDKLEAGLRIEKYKIVASNDDGIDEDVNQNEDDDKKNTNEDENEDDYDLEEMASQYFDDECEREPRDSEEACTSGINTDENGRIKQTRAPGEKLTMDGAQASTDEFSYNAEGKTKMKERTKMKKKRRKIPDTCRAKDQRAGASSDDIDKRNAKNSKGNMVKKKRKNTPGTSRAENQRARRLRKYVAEFFSSSGSSSNETSSGSEYVDSIWSENGNRMDGKMKVDKETGRHVAEDSNSEVQVTDEEVADHGQTDQIPNSPGNRCQRTVKKQDTYKLSKTDKGKVRRKKTVGEQTDDLEGETSDIESTEKSNTSPNLDTRRRFTRIRQKETGTKQNKYSKSRQRYLETDCRRQEECDDNHRGCHGNGGYLSMSCDESSQSSHEEETVVPSRKAVSAGARGRTRDGSTSRKKKSVTESLTLEDQGMDDKESKVEEILNKCGVRYTHANRSVVRTSKAESHMTKRAIEDVFELRQFSQQPANCFAAFEASEESDDVAEFTTCQSKLKCKKQYTKKPGKDSRPSQDAQPSTARSKATSSSGKPIDGTTEVIDGSTVIVGGTPRGIRRNHFREMSRCFGFASEVDFAVSVAKQTAENHRELLKTFYSKRNPDLTRLEYFTRENIEEATTSERGKKPQMTAVKSNEGKGRKCAKARRNDSSGVTAKRKKKGKKGVKMTSVGRGGPRRRGVVFDDDDDGDGDDDGDDDSDDDDDGDDDGDDDDDGLHKKKIFRKRKQKKRPCIKDDDDDDENDHDGDEDGVGYQNRNNKVRAFAKRNVNVVSRNRGSGSDEDDSSAQKTTITSSRKVRQRHVAKSDDDDDDDDDGDEKHIDDNEKNNENPQANEGKNEQQVTIAEISPRRRHIPLPHNSNSNQVPQTQCIASSSLSILDEFFGPTRDQESADTESVSVDLPTSSFPWQRRMNAQYTREASGSGTLVKERKDQHPKSILDDFI